MIKDISRGKHSTCRKDGENSMMDQMYELKIEVTCDQDYYDLLKHSCNPEKFKFGIDFESMLKSRPRKYPAYAKFHLDAGAMGLVAEQMTEILEDGYQIILQKE